MPDIPANCSSAERLQHSISAYFAHQEQQKSRLQDAEMKLEQLSKETIVSENFEGASLQAAVPVSVDENNSGKDFKIKRQAERIAFLEELLAEHEESLEIAMHRLNNPNPELEVVEVSYAFFAQFA